MINIARKYLGVNTRQIHDLINYYNDNCLEHVDSRKRYVVQKTDAWCGVFVSVVADMRGVDPKFFPYGCSVQLMKCTAMNRSIWSTVDRVKVGDLIVYDWNQNNLSDHIGIVVAVNNGTLKVIEGNIKNTVGFRNINVNSEFIEGIISL